MGVYICSIALASFILALKGDYCVYDQEWRSSVYCPILGVIFSVSSHGSLVVITFMSIVRCLICSRTVLEVKLSTAMVVSGILIMLNLANSIIPVLPFESVQNVFRTKIFFKNVKENPFITSNKFNRTHLDKLHFQYYSTHTDLYTTIRELNNMTYNNNLFDIVEIGYYGNSEMCVHNVFKTHNSYIFYKVGYCTVLTVLLAVLVITYAKIVQSKIASRKRVMRAGGNVPDQSIASLGVKVFLMIGTQALSWVSFIATMIYFQFDTGNPRPLFFEIFSLLVIPINSLLNPIFYSELYGKLAHVVLKAWHFMVSKTIKAFQQGGQETRDETTNASLKEKNQNVNSEKVEKTLLENDGQKVESPPPVNLEILSENKVEGTRINDREIPSAAKNEWYQMSNCTSRGKLPDGPKEAAFAGGASESICAKTSDKKSGIEMVPLSNKSTSKHNGQDVKDIHADSAAEISDEMIGENSEMIGSDCSIEYVDQFIEDASVEDRSELECASNSVGVNRKKTNEEKYSNNVSAEDADQISEGDEMK
jgi:hypothetical protein